MNEKLSSNLSYGWNWLIAVFGSVSTDAWIVIIAFIGMVTTAFINNYWQKRRFTAEFGSEKG